MVPWVGLQCVIVLFPDHAHLLLEALTKKKNCCTIWNVLHLFNFGLVTVLNVIIGLLICHLLSSITQ